MNQTKGILIETQTPTDTSRQLPFYLITFFIGLSFILIMSQWGFSAIAFSSSGEMLSTMPGVTGVNSIKSAMGKVLLGGVGALLLLLPSPAKRQYRIAPLIFFSGFLILCFSSVIWSINSDLTTRRLLVLLIFLIGVFGTVRHLSTRQLLDCAVVVSLVFVALGITAEISHGTFTPLLGDYRFFGTMHPNSQGSICAILVLSSYCGLRLPGSNRWMYLAALIIGLLFLFLTKSRSNIIACIIAAYLASFWNTSFRAKQILILLPLVIVCTVTLTMSLLIPDILGELDRLINIGRDLDTSHIITLHGRIPLWLFLERYILERPLLGYGYSGFWTPEMIASFGDYTMTWAGAAHSVIVDLFLQLGIVGVVLYGLSVLSVSYWVVRDCIVDGSAEAVFTFSLTLYALIFGLLESDFIHPKSFAPFVASVALFNCCIKDKSPKADLSDDFHPIN